MYIGDIHCQQLPAIQCNHMVPLYVEKVGKKVRVRVMPGEKDSRNIAVFQCKGSQGEKEYK